LILRYINRDHSDWFNPGRIRENFKSQEIQLNREAMDSLNSLETNFRYVDGSFWTIDGSPYSLEYLWG
jgi:alcohol dehydrogenase (NADP+)